MAIGLALGDLGRPFRQGNTAFNEGYRTSALLAPTAALALAAWQITPPTIVFGASELGVNEAIDALVGNYLAALFTLEPARDLLGRPTACEPLNDGGPQALIAFQARAFPAPGAGLLIGVTGFVTHLSATIALQLPRDG